MSKKPLLRKDYRPLDFRIAKTHLDFNFATPEGIESLKVTVKSTLDFERLTPGVTKFTLDGQHLKLLSVKVNGQVWENYTLEDLPGAGNFSQLHLDVVALANADQFVVEIENELEVANNKLLSGIYLAGKHICSQCESEGFRLITYYFDRPDNLSVFTVKITGDKTLFPYLLSNGNPVEAADLPSGQHYAVWHDPFPKPSYLFALVAGEFDVIEDVFVTKSGRKVDLRIFGEVGKAKQLYFAMSSLKRSMTWDEDRFGLEYDLDLFMIVAVSFFNMGAMENKGLNIFNESALIGDKDTATDDRLKRIDKVVAHEYFHNWTGDRVTCRDWFQLTLKEGLTVFRDQEFTSDTFDRTLERIESVAIVQNFQFDEDRGPTSHPIRPESVVSQDNFYTLTVYDKGSEVIRMIHTILGEENFQKGMRLYFERHDGQAVTCDDFVAAMADASGINLDKFKLWYSQSGTPHVTVKQSYNEQAQVLTLELSQITYPTLDQKEKQPLVLPLKTCFLNRQGEQVTNLKTLDNHQVPEVIILDQAYTKLEIVTQEHLLAVTNLDFSAPVIVHEERELLELAFIARNVPNEYARYQAIQDICFEVYKAFLTGNPVLGAQVLALYIDVYRDLVAHALDNPALYAHLLQFATPDVVSARFEENLDPLALTNIYKQVKETLTRAHKERALALFNDLPEIGGWEFNVQQAGLRHLRSTLLALITYTGEYKELVQALYDNADNYTDRFKALTINLHNQLGLTALEDDFVQRYYNEPLVLDNYQTARTAAATSIEQVKGFSSLHTYDVTNPNRVRAIVNALRYNFAVLYAKDGSGVDYISSLVETTNQFNPQLASVLVGLLLNFKKLTTEYRDIILSRLESLSKLNLSNNVREKVEKALAFANEDK